MLAAIKTTWALFLGLALIMLAVGLQNVLLGVRADIELFSTVVTGFIMSGYFFGFVLGSYVTPKLVRNVGHVRVFAALASLASVAVLCHVLLIDAPSWIVMRVITGFAYAGLYVVAESWLNDRSTNETRGQMLSIYMVVVLGGMGGGQVLINLYDPGSFELFLLASVLVSVALVPILLTASPAPAFEAPSSISLLELYRTSPLGVVGAFGTGMAQAALIGMGAVYAASIGLSVAQISLFMGLVYAGGMLLQWPIGRLSDSLDRRQVLTVTTLVAGAAAGVAFVLGLDFGFWPLLACIALLGGTSMPLYSLVVAHTNDHLRPEQMVAASGTLYLAVGLGASAGPILASLAMDEAGPKAYFLFLAVVHGAIGGFALYRMTRRAAVALDEQGDAIPMSQVASPVMGAIYAEEWQESESSEETSEEAVAVEDYGILEEDQDDARRGDPAP
ncbi:MAG: MFS transporter [Rhodovibrionaceae bacterium]